jgi:hypothetical protein
MTCRALAIALVAVTTCASCAVSTEGPAAVEIDAAFTTDESAVIVASNAEWDAIAKPWTGAGWQVVKGTPPHNTAAWTDGETKTITVQDGLPARTFRVTIKHELGHARGLDHVTNGVMRGGEGVSGPSTTEFSAEDLAECRRVRACL